MKSLFLAALAALALFSSANAQQYRDYYYHDSNRDAAHLVGALIEVAAHSAYDQRSHYYAGNRYGHSRHYDRYNNVPQYNYAPRYRHYRNRNHYTIYPGYRTPNYRPRYNAYRGSWRGHRN